MRSSATKRGRTGDKAEKTGKGLRHFAMKVCEKVQQKGVTTYNEVADELVIEQQVQSGGRLILRTHFTEGCGGVDDQTLPPGRVSCSNKLYL